MDFIYKVLFGLHVHSCTHWLRPRNPAFGLIYEGAIGQPKYRSLCDALATIDLLWVSKCSFSCDPRATSTVHSEHLEENPLWPSDRECSRKICMGGGGGKRGEGFPPGIHADRILFWLKIFSQTCRKLCKEVINI